jgi:hypothetical protein
MHDAGPFAPGVVLASPEMRLSDPPGRPRAAILDISLVERAAPQITELGADLDRRLKRESRTPERLRLLREATNRITRTANDAIQAYRRARRSLDAELQRTNADVDGVRRLEERLTVARTDVLQALDAANGRYPWADSTPPADPTAEGHEPSGAG